MLCLRYSKRRKFRIIYVRFFWVVLLKKIWDQVYHDKLQQMFIGDFLRYLIRYCGTIKYSSITELKRISTRIYNWLECQFQESVQIVLDTLIFSYTASTTNAELSYQSCCIFFHIFLPWYKEFPIFPIVPRNCNSTFQISKEKIGSYQ